ncbi:repair protein PSO2 SNM1 [Coemansia biformis]|uniref:Repair protein PSO2 SNM1 n=1 Tax=Coemansia biformis TaxID=1286918 RepID=A0A9W8D1X0_9FUNG|nr:repair protein PSO2 SNM1 [Coemansia biformis]
MPRRASSGASPLKRGLAALDDLPDAARHAKPARAQQDCASEGPVVACLVCQMQLAGMSPGAIELHVNGCLDVVLLEDRKRARRTRKPTCAPPDQMAYTNAQPSQPLAGPTPEARTVHGIQQPAAKNAKEMLCEIEEADMDVGALEAQASTANNVPGSAQGRQGQRPLPSYKRMPHTSFTVDAFQYGRLDFCTAYFLTHFHSDHYGGLTKGFSGAVYCSRITANCVINKIGVDPAHVHALPMNTRCVVQGVSVTLIDANHCPGAAVVLFEIPLADRLVRIVHTGDFRASRAQIAQILCVFGTEIHLPVTPAMLAAAAATTAECASGQTGCLSPLIDYVYLDTTYLDPGYSFPKQSEVVEAVAQLCSQAHLDSAFIAAFLQHSSRASSETPRASHGLAHQASPSPSGSVKLALPSLITRWFQAKQPAPGAARSSRDLLAPGRKQRILFVVGAYIIGKERLFIEIALRLGAKIYVAPEKHRMLQCIGSPSLLALLTTSMSEAQVHVVSMGQITMPRMAEYLQTVRKAGAPFSRVVAVKPTGWSHAGHGFSWRKQAPVEYPQELTPAEADLAWTGGGASGLTTVLARAARMDGWWAGSSGSRFDAKSLKPHGSSSTVTIFPVPYSEHSSFAELAGFVCSLKVARVIPTVVSSGDKNQLADSWLQHWQALNAEFEHRLTAANDAAPDGRRPVLGLAAIRE